RGATVPTAGRAPADGDRLPLALPWHRRRIRVLRTAGGDDRAAGPGRPRPAGTVGRADTGGRSTDDLANRPAPVARDEYGRGRGGRAGGGRHGGLRARCPGRL